VKCLIEVYVNFTSEFDGGHGLLINTFAFKPDCVCIAKQI